MGRVTCRARPLICGQPAIAIDGERLLDFLARVHHERTVLYHRLPQRLRCQQQEAYTFGCGLYAHAVAFG